MENLTLEKGDDEQVLEELVLSRRIKLVYHVYRIGRRLNYIDDSLFKTMFEWVYSIWGVTVKPEDVHYTFYRPKPENSVNVVEAEFTLFVRDFSFLQQQEEDKEEEKKKEEEDDDLNNARKFLIQKFGVLKHKDLDTPFEFRVMLPLTEQPQKMLNQFLDANPEYSCGRKRGSPVIILTGLPSRWFPQHNPPQTFLLKFGVIRYLDVVRDGDERCAVMVKYNDYDDFCKAFKTLCSCSLSKRDSGEMVDYEVSLSTDECFPLPPADGGLRVVLYPR